MADEQAERATIFDLYAGESEPITISDGEREVIVKYRKRTERERLACDEYARTRRQALTGEMIIRRVELMEGIGKLDRERQTKMRLSLMRLTASLQGLDLFDDLEDESGDQPATIEELEAQRAGRLDKYLEDRKEELDELSDQELLEEVVDVSVENELSLRVGLAALDKNIALTCWTVDTGELVFASPEELLDLQPMVVERLRAELNRFMRPEGDKEARRLANDPNSSGTTD